MTDIAFVACAGGAGPHDHAALRRAVMVGGRRARTVDVHAHCAFPEAMVLLGVTYPAAASPGLPPVLKVDADQIPARLAAMDAQGIDMEVLSVNPLWYGADHELARQVVELQNDGLAQVIGRHPDRFAALATVALQHPDLAARQLEHAVSKLGLKGALVGGSVAGDELADPKFHPFWAKAEDLGALIFIHPQGAPEAAKRLRGSGGLGNVIGNPLETTIALSHLIFEGTLDRFPGLKILAAHGGGYLPSYAARSDAGIRTFPDTYRVPLKKAPTAYLKDLYYDALVFTPEALRHLAAEVGADRIMMGTDFPYPWTDRAVEHILETPGLSDEDKVSMLGGLADPPAHAVILSMDEKSQIQALDRTQPGLPLKKGRAGTMTHDYKRHGTTTLFAALNVLDGSVIGRCMQRHRHQEFIRFLNQVEAEVAGGKVVHAIVDNYATHKHPKVRAWLARHPRWTFHFTPTSASWLNAVEGFFSALTRRRLKRGVFRSIVDLQAAINRFVAEHNGDPKPFNWTADPQRVLAAISRGNQALESLH
jgi:aminocarboxymuconate-semialdehyde decarboxylase